LQCNIFPVQEDLVIFTCFLGIYSRSGNFFIPIGCNCVVVLVPKSIYFLYTPRGVESLLKAWGTLF